MYPDAPSQGLTVPNSGVVAVGASHLLHGSPLTLAKNPSLTSFLPGLLGGADQNCNKAAAPPVSQPNLVICERFGLNGATEDYIAGTNLWNRPARPWRLQREHPVFSAVNRNQGRLDSAVQHRLRLQQSPASLPKGCPSDHQPKSMCGAAIQLQVLNRGCGSPSARI